MPNEVMSPTEHETKRHYWLRDDFEELIRVIPGADFPMPNDANSVPIARGRCEGP